MEDIKQNAAFQQMDIQKQQMIMLLIQSLQNKNLTQALPVIMNWNKQMQQEKVSFTSEENALLTAILSAQMTPEQRKQYETIQAMMKNMR
ncbi:MAG TPA: hypothetical protein DDY31_03765 [Lachnospiraceae bacterium]|nr:hypothetical protein [Lachnospiraceae bacterium]